MITIEVAGVDLAMANMGLARAYVTPRGDDFDIVCAELLLVKTEGQDKKVVRKSSNDLRRAQELVAALRRFTGGSTFLMVEVPGGGSLSATGARALGLAVGVIACVEPHKVIEVSPMEVKAAVAGVRKGKQVTKDEIIAWAAKNWPEGQWLRAEHKSTSPAKVLEDGSIMVRKTLPAGRLTKDNEHIADAMAAIKAGTMTPAFRHLMAALIRRHQDEASRPADNRPASGVVARMRIPVGAFPLAEKDDTRRARKNIDHPW